MKLINSISTDFEWFWDNSSKSSASCLKQDQREVVFHVDYSCGTAAVRGTVPMCEDQYYWEVKMTTPVYGTDMVNVHGSVVTIITNAGVIMHLTLSSF